MSSFENLLSLFGFSTYVDKLKEILVNAIQYGVEDIIVSM